MGGSSLIHALLAVRLAYTATCALRARTAPAVHTSSARRSSVWHGVAGAVCRAAGPPVRALVRAGRQMSSPEQVKLPAEVRRAALPCVACAHVRHALAPPATCGLGSAALSGGAVGRRLRAATAAVSARLAAARAVHMRRPALTSSAQRAPVRTAGRTPRAQEQLVHHRLQGETASQPVAVAVGLLAPPVAPPVSSSMRRAATRSLCIRGRTREAERWDTARRARSVGARAAPRLKTALF